MGACMPGAVENNSRSQATAAPLGAELALTDAPAKTMPVVTSDRPVMQSTPRAEIERQQQANFEQRNAAVVKKYVNAAVATMLAAEPPVGGLHSTSVDRDELDKRAHMPEVQQGIKDAFAAIGFETVAVTLGDYVLDFKIRASGQATTTKGHTATSIEATQNERYENAIGGALSKAVQVVKTKLLAAEPSTTHTVTMREFEVDKRDGDPQFRERVAAECRALGYPFVTVERHYGLKIVLSTEEPPPPKRAWWKFWG